MPPLPDLRSRAARIAQKYGIPVGTFSSLISAESGWNPQAVSPAGAIGLGQLMPATAEGLGVNPRDPIQNLDGAARYLQQQYDRFGKWDLALAAYNAGPGAVEKYGGIPPYEETQNYVQKVLGGAETPSLPETAGGGDVGFLNPPSGTPSPAPQPTPSKGISLRDALNFAAPSPRAVGILGRLGGTAERIASSSTGEIPLPPEPVARTLQQMPTGSTKSGREVIDLQVDFDGPINPAAGPIIQQARQFLGTPYVWGGADPRTGFDCSGFVQWLYRQQGISLPRTTYEQVKVGEAISDPTNLRPGDIVFFNDDGDIHHEGLFIGNGQFIHSPKTGDVVKISSLSEPYYAEQFYVGRRVYPKVKK